MSPDKIFVIISGIVGVVFIIWFFFGKKEEAATVNGNDVKIEVGGGYNPSTIVLKKGKQTILRFLRIDPSSCLEEVVIPDFKIRKFLPLKEEVQVGIKPEKVGEFSLSCGMNMFHGKIVVRD
jgi:plastocyanin domain-containing protein